MPYTLVIGNKNYSSWSLRAWLFLRASGLEFNEVRIPLFVDGWRDQIARHSPAGRVPVLVDGELSVWDTMAIYSHVREAHPQAVGWPAGREARAVARSIAAEMHSGFLGVRSQLPQNLRARRRRELGELSERTRIQVKRILEIWTDCRRRFGQGGPWLFGAFSLADVVFAPVALRFVTYDIPVEGAAAQFVAAVQAHPDVGQWVDEAAAETERIVSVDELIPADESPMTLG